MKRLQLLLDVESFKSADELEPEFKELYERAKGATGTAYAPYSNFYVGAAALLENGEIVTGSNQENASFPAGICAERTVLSATVSKYPDMAVKALAVAVKHKGRFIKDLTAPCGICRQSIKEFENKTGSAIAVIFPGTDGRIFKVNSIESLLPLSFSSDKLKK